MVSRLKFHQLDIHDVPRDSCLTDLTELNSFIIAFILHSLKHFCFDVVKVLYIADTSVLLCNLKITSSNNLNSKLITLS